MRLEKAVIIAKKDLAEFAKNRYVLMTIVLMPLIISVVLPVIYVLPINTLSKQSTKPVTLELSITMKLNNTTLTNAVLFGTELDHVTIVGSVIQGCSLRNSTVVNSTVTESLIGFSVVRTSILTRCVLFNLTTDSGNVLHESQYVNGNADLENIKTLMFNLLLILLIMTPVTIPTVTASYSFVGEKVNKSLEPLLATPITDMELLVGKSGSIFAVSMGATWISFVVSTVMVDVLTKPALGYYPLPNTYWMIGVLLLAPAMCMMSILTNVIISSRVNDVRVSQQIGGVLVLPIMLFLFLSIAGVLSTGPLPMLLFSIAVLAADAGILMLALRIFNREEILVSWK
jgi:ABC-2 type transport system permease protein